MTQTRKKLVFSWVLILAMVISVISPGSAFVVKAAEVGVPNIGSLSNSYQAKLAGVTEYLKENVDLGDKYSYGFEWRLIQLARSGQDEKQLYHKYYNLLNNMIEENGVSNFSTYSYGSITIILSAIGADPTNIGGRNLLEGLADFSVLEQEAYASGIAYALIALDSKNYEVPKVSVENLTTKDKLVGLLVSKLDSETGLSGYYETWNNNTYVEDIDTTGMIIQALAPYYEHNDDVKNIINKSLDTLSKRQGADGSFPSQYDNVCTTAQVVCALTALNIDPEKDTRFLKNGNSGVDYLLSNYNEETGAIAPVGAYNEATTSDQAGYALVAYDRFVKEAEALYDMSDVTTPIYHYGGKATCVKRAVCEVCGVEYGEVDPANHTGKTSLKNVKEATCTAVGYTGDKVCDDCGVIIEKGKETEKKAHTPVEIPAVAATETTTGKTAGKKCSVCGEILEAPKDVPATGVKETLSTDYKATSTDAANATVEYTAATDQGETSVTIQNVIKDSNGKEYAVTKVSDGAFANNKKLTDVTIGANVTEIGADAFKNCTKLSEVIIQDDSVTTIGAGAFSGAKALTEIDFSECKLQTIDQNAFSGCKKLKDIKLNGNKLTKVGKNAFKNVKKNAKFTIYAKNKKTYNKVVKLIKKSGAKKVKFAYKKKK